ncbi:MAG: phosphopantetheine-binding protein, partial [Thermoleophilia bacterium]
RDGSIAPLLRGLVNAPARREAAVESLAPRLAGLSEAERLDVVLELVRAEAAVALGHASGRDVLPERTFKEAGLDSLGGVELRNRLAAAIGAKLPATAIFDHPTPHALAEFVAARFAASDPGPAPAMIEIDRIEDLLAAAADEERLRALGRLRALLDREAIDGEGRDRAANGQQDLDEASDEEMIRIIEDEFGAV